MQDAQLIQWPARMSSRGSVNHHPGLLRPAGILALIHSSPPCGPQYLPTLDRNDLLSSPSLAGHDEPEPFGRVDAVVGQRRVYISCTTANTARAKVNIGAVGIAQPFKKPRPGAQISTHNNAGTTMQPAAGSTAGVDLASRQR